MFTRIAFLTAIAALSVVGCSPGLDGTDAGQPSGRDSGAADAGQMDSGTTDSGIADSGTPDSGANTPTACAVVADAASSVVLTSAWASQGHDEVQVIDLSTDNVPQCCATIPTSGAEGSVELVFHDDGPGSYEVMSGFVVCELDGGASCNSAFTAGATMTLQGQKIAGVGTFNVGTGAVFDGLSTSGSIDVTFGSGSSSRHLTGTLAAPLCGTE